MSAPGGLARRFWGTASAYQIPATSWRRHSPPDTMARHRYLRRAVASASAKMPWRMCPLGLTDLKSGSSETANAPTPPMSAPGGLAWRFWGTASANQMPATSSCDKLCLTQWRFTVLYGAQWRRRRRRFREGCVLWADRHVVQRRIVRRHHLCRRQAPLHGVSGATR